MVRVYAFWTTSRWTLKACVSATQLNCNQVRHGSCHLLMLYVYNECWAPGVCALSASSKLCCVFSEKKEPAPAFTFTSASSFPPIKALIWLAFHSPQYRPSLPQDLDLRAVPLIPCHARCLLQESWPSTSLLVCRMLWAKA
jgi:hypothetical protein